MTTLVVVSVPLVFLAVHYTTSGSPGNAVRGRDGRWRVNYWMITKLHGPFVLRASLWRHSHSDAGAGLCPAGGSQPKKTL